MGRQYTTEEAIAAAKIMKLLRTPFDFKDKLKQGKNIDYHATVCLISKGTEVNEVLSMTTEEKISYIYLILGDN